MEFKLYNTTSPHNSLGKNLTDEMSLNGTLKDYNSISSPILTFNFNSLPHYNYCYIPIFKRYYFITDITIKRMGVIELSLTVDVLESFKDDILNSRGVITKSKDFNPYVNDDYESEVRQEITIYKSNRDLTMGNSLVLVTIGGV